MLKKEKALKILLSRILPNVSSNMVKLTPEWPFPTNDFRRIDGIVFRIHIKEITVGCEKLDSELHKR